VCLTVLAGDLGPADIGLDIPLSVMVLSRHLALRERVILARRVLAAAGMEQPGNLSADVICLCGLLLDLTLPIFCLPPPGGPSVPRAAGGSPAVRELAAASTGEFPAIRDEPRAG
jgi:hypothetical protein